MTPDTRNRISEAQQALWANPQWRQKTLQRRKAAKDRKRWPLVVYAPKEPK